MKGLNDEHLLQIGKACQKLERVYFTNTNSITDEGIVNGLYVFCPRLKHLNLLYCEKITGFFFTQLPQSMKSVKMYSSYNVSLNIKKPFD